MVQLRTAESTRFGFGNYDDSGGSYAEQQRDKRGRSDAHANFRRVPDAVWGSLFNLKDKHVGRWNETQRLPKRS
jgi:hypothetical protein